MTTRSPMNPLFDNHCISRTVITFNQPDYRREISVLHGTPAPTNENLLGLEGHAKLVEEQEFADRSQHVIVNNRVQQQNSQPEVKQATWAALTIKDDSEDEDEWVYHVTSKVLILPNGKKNKQTSTVSHKHHHRNGHRPDCPNASKAPNAQQLQPTPPPPPPPPPPQQQQQQQQHTQQDTTQQEQTQEQPQQEQSQQDQQEQQPKQKEQPKKRKHQKRQSQKEHHAHGHQPVQFDDVNFGSERGQVSVAMTRIHPHNVRNKHVAEAQPNQQKTGSTGGTAEDANKKVSESSTGGQKDQKQQLVQSGSGAVGRGAHHKQQQKQNDMNLSQSRTSTKLHSDEMYKWMAEIKAERDRVAKQKAVA